MPPVVHGSKWEDGDTEDMANDISYFAFEPGGKWHSFQGYTKSQYFIDPMKLQLMTPGINILVFPGSYWQIILGITMSSRRNAI